MSALENDFNFRSYQIQIKIKKNKQNPWNLFFYFDIIWSLWWNYIHAMIYSCATSNFQVKTNPDNSAINCNSVEKLINIDRNESRLVLSKRVLFWMIESETDWNCFEKINEINRVQIDINWMDFLYFMILFCWNWPIPPLLYNMRRELYTCDHNPWDYVKIWN